MENNVCSSFNVPVVDVHWGNFQTIWPRLVHAIQSSTFVALDCELSGLGNRKLINAQSVEDRYTHIANAAKTRSVISLGLSCFKLEKQAENMQFSVQTFNLMALCMQDYVVEPAALKFLVEHGFDFHKQYSLGIQYYPGSDRVQVTKGWTVRDLFAFIVKSRCPIVLHNGMVDLLFLYQNFYAELPGNLATFTADLEMLFPVGIYDTKYIAEFELRATASFLEFIFRKEQVRNWKRIQSQKRAVVLRHNSSGIDQAIVDVWNCSLPPISGDLNVTICKNYKNFGFCTKANKCEESHDIFAAIMQEEFKISKKRKRKGDEDINTIEEENVSEREEMKVSFKGHRAGHDAFMTGFVFASYIAQSVTENMTESEDLLKNLAKARNRICLSGKQFPLLVQKSSFAKYSKEHLAKYEKIMNE